jgi:hypothetical protein
MEAYKILKECSDILRKKGKDYNLGSIRPDDYFLFGRISYLQMIHLKYTRLRSLMESKKPNYESIEDTLIDLINYAALFAEYERNNK